MRILLDTNVLLRMGDHIHPMNKRTCDATALLQTQGHELVLTPQILYEYWVAATRPVENNGLGLSVSIANNDISLWLKILPLLTESNNLFERWRELVTAYEVRGKNAHDARIVAAMQHHGITALLTYNQADFLRFSTIKAITPNEVLSGKFTV
jgi:predicted nucleic acid-binding protein